MRIGRPIPELTLAEDEHETLERWIRRAKAGQALAQRCRIIVRAAGNNNGKIAAELGLCPQTVGKWRTRFLERRLDGLLDEPRPGATRKITDADVEHAVTMTLETMPDGATHWSTRSLARKAGLSQSAVSRIWRAFALQPHRTESFKLSTDPLFIEKVRDIVGLYMTPPDRALVLCADEKSQIQALDRMQPLLPMRPGQVERRTHDYTRYGTTSLFAALNVKTGQVLGACQRRHRSIEFRRFLNRVDVAIPPRLDIHIVMDNYATHKTAIIRAWLAAHPRYHVHFTPTGSSWINLVERFFAALTEKQLRRGAYRSTRELEGAIYHYLDVTNSDPKPFVWTKTADQILASLARFCKRISDSGH